MSSNTRVVRPWGKHTRVYLGILLLHLLAIVLTGVFEGSPSGLRELLYASKLSLMPTLLFGIWAQIGRPSSYWIAAIIFSWIGDFWLLPDLPVLMPQALVFRLGLLSFLIAHICYIRRLNAIGPKRIGLTRGLKIAAIIAGCVLSVLILFLAFSINWAVVIVSVIPLLLVLIYAGTLLTVSYKSIKLGLHTGSYRPVAYGAIAFVASDAIIGLGLIIPSLAQQAVASFFIMILYGLAQLGLAQLAIDTNIPAKANIG